MESCSFYKSRKPCALGPLYKKEVSTLCVIQGYFEVVVSAFRAAILGKTTVSLCTRCASQASCTSDRLTSAFCCDSPSLKMIVV